MLERCIDFFRSLKPVNAHTLTDAQLEAERARRETDDLIDRLNQVSHDLRWRGEERRSG
jgi:hypothetical protein